MATASNNQFKLSGPRGGDDQSLSVVTLYCHLSPEISAVTMEIRWFKETDCVCLYKNRQVTEGRGYEGRVSLITQELRRGNVSLQIKDCRLSDRGDYLCQVTNGYTTEECSVFVGAWRSLGTGELTGVKVHQSDRKWTKEERMKMKESALLIVEDEHFGTKTAMLNVDTGVEFVDKNRAELIQRVKEVMEIVDCLQSKNMLTEERCAKIQSKETPQEQMRELFKALDSAKPVKEEFYEILKIKLPFLVNELED